MLMGVALPAVADSTDATGELSFQHYLASVGRGNLELAAARAQLPVLKAGVLMAKVFPNPVITAGLSSFDVSGEGAPTGIAASVAMPLELGGKRGDRVKTARADYAVAQAQLIKFFWQLRADAAIAFIDALQAQLILSRKRNTLEGLDRLVHVMRFDCKRATSAKQRLCNRTLNNAAFKVK